ncbi:hypothetical protein GCM10009623_15890 [Nocardioides aestuarii]|uniref:Uncharacterized protein n=1 Tax=Nocardioides aestuarii TaxID=252231 RepID=A0ABW4TJA3_9ACTN
MTTPSWARTLVTLACRLLPAGQVRDRWREELLADLEVLAGRERAAYVVGVVVNAWALRSAVRGGQAGVAVARAARRPLGCRLNLRHSWHVVSTEDGHPYWECRDCHKTWVTVRPPGDWSPGF